MGKGRYKTMMKTTTEKDVFRKVVAAEFGPLKPALCKFCLELLDSVPHEFWEMPASSSGMHHPEFALGVGGLARHSLMVYRWLKTLLDANPQDMSDFAPAMCLAALFHDCCKHGLPGEVGERTKFEHPLLSAKFVLDQADRFVKENKAFIDSTCDDEETFRSDIAVAVSCIETHMGRFNTRNGSEVKLPTPKTALQYMVHLADYCASRKFTTFDSDFFVKL